MNEQYAEKYIMLTDLPLTAFCAEFLSTYPKYMAVYTGE
jgi:hypothetical protein